MTTNIAATATGPTGYVPRTLNTFETAICEAWYEDSIAAYQAVDAWATNVAPAKRNDALTLLINARKRGLSPSAVCDEIRKLLEEKTAS